MEYSTGYHSRKVQVMCNTWSDEAREAALKARQEGSSGGGEDTYLGKGFGGKISGGKQTESQPAPKSPNSTETRDAHTLTPAQQKMKAEGDKGRANYASLSDKEKKQFDTDWKDAHKATAAANKSPSKETHQAAADAHSKAAKSAPSNLAYHHKIMAHVHGNMAKNNPKGKLSPKHNAAATQHLQAISKGHKMAKDIQNNLKGKAKQFVKGKGKEMVKKYAKKAIKAGLTAAITA